MMSVPFTLKSKSVPWLSTAITATKKGKPQDFFGLMTVYEGCSVAISVYPGNTGKLNQIQIDKLKQLEGIDWVSL